MAKELEILRNGMINMDCKEDSVHKAKRKPIVVLFTIIGACCILQFFVVGIINVIRGYSIGSYLPTIILMLGSCVFIALLCACRKNPASVSAYIWAVSLAGIYMSLIGMSHNWYLEKAKGYYETGEYQQALGACEKEAGLWYHLLSYNYHERNAMNMMAKAYCQLGDFDSASDVYKLMIARYSGEYYSGLARESLAKLEKGLKIVAYYPDNLVGMPKPDYVRETGGHLDAHAEVMALYYIAGTYRFDLNCYAKTVEVYTEILGKDVSEETKKSAKENILKLSVGLLK